MAVVIVPEEGEIVNVAVEELTETEAVLFVSMVAVVPLLRTTSLLLIRRMSPEATLETVSVMAATV